MLDGKPVLIDGAGSENRVTSDDADADWSITMSFDTWRRLQLKQIKPIMATLTRKLKVKGDIGLAQKLKSLT